MYVHRNINTSHPSEQGYEAGTDFGRKFPKATREDARRASKAYEDSESFMDGFDDLEPCHSDEPWYPTND